MNLNNRWTVLLLSLIGLQALVIAALLFPNSAQRLTGLGVPGAATPDQKAAAAAKSKPAKVEKAKVAGEPPRVILIAKAAERLGIATAQVSERPIERLRTFYGEVVVNPSASTTINAPVDGIVSMPESGSIPDAGAQLSAGQSVLRIASLAGAGEDKARDGMNKGKHVDLSKVASFMSVGAPPGTTIVRMHVEAGDAVEQDDALFDVADSSKVLVRIIPNSEKGRIASGLSAAVRPLEGTGKGPGIAGRPVDMSSFGAMLKAPPGAMYYEIEGAGHGLVPGQRVRVAVKLADSGSVRRVIPLSAIIYDQKGQAWTFTSPEPLTYVRHRVNVDFVEGNEAIISEGPAPGTQVVTVGGILLYGAESEKH
jgi:hypothetical protein